VKGIAVIYPDKYAVEEAFQLLKIPWEWYNASKDYDIVIGRKEDLNSEDVNFNLIDLSEDDVFKRVGNLLNLGIEHNKESFCDVYLDSLRKKLKQFTTLVEISPIPWGYSYMIALTQDVDITSVRERSWISVGIRCLQLFFESKYSGR